MFLTKYARKVTLIVREPDYTCAKTVSDQLKQFSNIETVFETELVEAGGEQALSYAVFKNNKDGTQWRYDAPQERHLESLSLRAMCRILNGLQTVWRAEQGYLITDIDQQTNVPGVFAAGDVCVKNLRQVVTAVSDGAVAATSLERVVSELHTKLSIPDLYVAPEDHKPQDSRMRRPILPKEKALSAMSSGSSLQAFFQSLLRW